MNMTVEKVNKWISDFEKLVQPTNNVTMMDFIQKIVQTIL